MATANINVNKQTVLELLTSGQKIPLSYLNINVLILGLMTR